jgi:hypothetical protein
LRRGVDVQQGKDRLRVVAEIRGRLAGHRVGRRPRRQHGHASGRVVRVDELGGVPVADPQDDERIEGRRRHPDVPVHSETHFHSAPVRQPPGFGQDPGGQPRHVVELQHVEVVADGGDVQGQGCGKLPNAVGVDQPDLKAVRQAGRPVHRERDVLGLPGAVDAGDTSGARDDVRPPEAERPAGADRRGE